MTLDPLEPRPPRRAWFALLGTALALAVAASGCSDGDRGGFGTLPPAATASPTTTPSEEPTPATRVAVRAPGGLRFEPTTLEARAGEQLEIEFQNLDDQDHTFAVDELNVLMLAAPGQTVRATVSIHRRNVGSFRFYCSIPGHREGGMEGTFQVRR